MKVSEAFLVNTKNFESIIKALVEYESEEPVINSNLLEILGYSDPNDLLVIRLLKDLNVISNDGEPGPYFEEFKNKETTKKALARGLLDAYEQLFEEHPQIHQRSPEKIRESFNDLFQGKKTELIIKYISSTFQKVVSYVGVSTIDEIINEDEGNETQETEQLETSSVEAVAESHKNGLQNATDRNADIIAEKIGNKHIDDLVKDFDAKKDGEEIENSDETEDKEEQEPDFTVKEFIQDENENSTDEDSEDPFDLGPDTDEMEEEQESSTETAIETEGDERESTDRDPVKSEIPLSSDTQNFSPMSNLVKEKDFVQKALLRKSDLLHKMERWEELIPALQDIIDRFDDEAHPGLTDVVSKSLIRKAIALLKLDDNERALPALNRVIERLSDSENKEFYDQASRAMLFKTQILENRGDGDLLPLYNQIIDRMDSSSDLMIKEKLDNIRIKRYDLLLNEGDEDEILKASKDLIRRFKNNGEYRNYLEQAMIKRAEILDEQGQYDEAIEAYDEFLATFG